MDNQFYLQGPEDEMEFMPIIPLNEDDDGSADGQVIPDEIPILALRNTVLFPGVVIPITVGRDKSIKAVNDAYKADKLIGVVAQKDSNVEEPTVSDLEDILRRGGARARGPHAPHTRAALPHEARATEAPLSISPFSARSRR